MENWVLGGEILDQGWGHPSLKVVIESFAALQGALSSAQERSKNLKKFGAGRTCDPVLLNTLVVPALRELAEVAKLVSDQMEERLTKD